MLRKNTEILEKEATRPRHKLFSELKLRKGSMEEVKCNSECEGQTAKTMKNHNIFAGSNA